MTFDLGSCLANGRLFGLWVAEIILRAVALKLACVDSLFLNGIERDDFLGAVAISDDGSNQQE